VIPTDDLARQLGNLDALAQDTDDIDTLIGWLISLRETLKHARLVEDSIAQRIAKLAGGSGVLDTAHGPWRVSRVADRVRADWDSILNALERAALYDTDTGERITDDPAEAVHRLREIVAAVAPITASVKPRKALDRYVEHRDDVVDVSWSDRYSVRPEF
jgi:hypothetical protein